MAAKKAKKALSLWLWDWAIEHWPGIVLAVATATTTVLGAVSAALKPLGPVAYAAAGGAAFFFLSVAFWIVARARRTWAEASYRSSLAERTVSVNPMLSSFERQRIHVGDFFDPIASEPHKSRSFKDCDIVGPGALALMGCTLNKVGFRLCDIVVVKKRPYSHCRRV